LRKRVRRTEIDSGQRPGITTEESEQIKALKRENAELRRANEILKAGGCRVDGSAVWISWRGGLMRPAKAAVV